MRKVRKRWRQFGLKLRDDLHLEDVLAATGGGLGVPGPQVPDRKAGLFVSALRTRFAVDPIYGGGDAARGSCEKWRGGNGNSFPLRSSYLCVRIGHLVFLSCVNVPSGLRNTV